MCIIDGSVDCIIDPISNALHNYISPFFNWILDTLYNILTFIYNIGVMFKAVYDLITGLLFSIFATNFYAAAVFSIIMTWFSLILFFRIYSIIAGMTILGFKLPELKKR